MKIVTRVFSALLLVAVWAMPASAQTSIDQTSLSAAVTTTSQNVVVIGSATCTNCTFGRGTILYTIDGEMMVVTGAYTSGTSVPVLRGQGGTPAITHPSGTIVFVGSPNRFGGVPGGVSGVAVGANVEGDPGGSCTRTSLQFIPYINVQRGRIWDCLNSIWALGNTDPGVSPTVVGRTIVNNTNYTVLNTDYIVAITSMTGVKTITLPSAVLNPGKVIVIVDESGVLSASTSATIASTAGSVNAVTSLTFSVPYAVLRFYSNGTNWWGW